MCISDGVLRARLDGELAEADSSAVNAHLAACEKCQRRAEEMAARAARVGALFSGLGPASAQANTDTAFARLEARAATETPQRSWLPRLFAMRPAPAWGTVAVAAIALVLVSSTSARAVAQRLLGLLRVKTVVVVPMRGDILADGKGELLGKLLSESVTVDKKSQPLDAASAEEAARVAGFTVRLPTMRQDPPRLKVLGQHAFHLTVDAARVQAFLGLLGRSDLVLPAGLAGAKVAVDIPSGVEARYGDCLDRHGPARNATDWSNCVLLLQVPTPTVVTLPELDLSRIAEIGLQLAGLSAEDARMFSRTVDWASTLAIPLPQDAGDHQTVTVNGVQGVLLTGRPHGSRPAGWALVWIKDGIAYSLSGYGNPVVALPLAESMG